MLISAHTAADIKSSSALRDARTASKVKRSNSANGWNERGLTMTDGDYPIPSLGEMIYTGGTEYTITSVGWHLDESRDYSQRVKRVLRIHIHATAQDPDYSDEPEHLV